MDNASDIIFVKDELDQFTITDIAFNELIAFIIFYLYEVFKITGIGQKVEVDDLVIWISVYEIGNKVRTDKAGAAGDEDGDVILLLLFR